MPGGADISLGRHRAIPGDLAVHLSLRRQGRTARSTALGEGAKLPHDTGPGLAVPAPMSGAPLALIPSCGARVRDDLTAVVDAVDGRAMPAESEGGGVQQRPALPVAPELVRALPAL